MANGGHGFDGYDGLGGLGGFDRLGGFGGFDAFSGFDGFSGFGGFDRLGGFCGLDGFMCIYVPSLYIHRTTLQVFRYFTRILLDKISVVIFLKLWKS